MTTKFPGFVQIGQNHDPMDHCCFLLADELKKSSETVWTNGVNFYVEQLCNQALQEASVEGP